MNLILQQCCINNGFSIFATILQIVRTTFLLLTSIISLAITAQDACIYTISGRVLDDHDRTPLPDAAIFLKGSQLGTYSDSLGYYILRNVCEGSYIIVVQHLGCEDVERKIIVSRNMTLNFLLEHHEEELKEIIVRTRELLYETPTQASTQIKGEAYKAVADKNLGSLLESITGVSSLQTGPGISKPVIHGITGNRILLFNNGIKLESQQWGPDHAPEIDPFASGSVTVIKGAGAVRYGTDALGGVVLLEPAPLPTKKGIRGESITVFRSNGRQWIQSNLLEGGTKKDGWGWRMQGSYKRSGDQHAPRYSLTNTGSQEGGASAAIGYKKFRYGTQLSYNFYHNDIGILRSAHIGNLTDLQLALERDTPFVVEPFSYKINNPRQRVDHHLLKLKGYYRLKDRLMLSALYAMQHNLRKEFDIRRGGRDDIPALNMQLGTHLAEISLEHQDINNWTGISGIAALAQYNYNIPGTGVNPLIPDYASQTLSTFHLQKYATNTWEAEIGFRYEYNHLLVKRFENNILVKPEFNFHNFALTAGAIYYPNEYIHLKTNVGGYSRSPQVNELYSAGLHHSAAAIEYGKEDLQPERGFKWVTTIDGRVKDIFKWELTPHIARVNNFIYLVADSMPELTIRGAFPVFRYVQTTALIGGADLEAVVKPHPYFSVGAKASLVYGRDISKDQWLIYMPPVFFEPSLGYEQPFGKHSISVQTQVPIVWKQSRYESALDIAAPPAGHTLWHMQTRYGIQLEKVKLQVTVEAENMLDKSYRNYMNRLRYYADDTGRSFNLKCRITY
jgi:iron complex outermembrane recepter protein